MLTIVGNSLNSSNKKVLDKMNKMDFTYIRKEAEEQIKAGASFIELNAVSLLHNEIPFLRKAVPLIEDLGGKVLIRSSNTDTLAEVINISQRELIIGDFEFNKSKLEPMLDLIKSKDVRIVAVAKENMKDEEFCPEKSLFIAQKFIDFLLDNGIKRKNILLDPIVSPLEENFSNGRVFLNTLELFKLDFPQVRTIANLNYLSEGLPKRHLINSSFLTLAVAKGIDYVVINNLEKSVTESLTATLSIIGKDKNLQSYMKFCRGNKKGA